MDTLKALGHVSLAPKLKFVGEYDVEVPNLTGTTWLDSLTEDLESEAILALLEGRDPQEAVNVYLDHETENCPASCMQEH